MHYVEEEEEEEEEEPLLKNSIICCNVDNLQPGMIIASYTHSNRIYQGVLLELNRQRGIPAGISFPKDFCPVSAVTTEEVDPSQVPPIHDRHPKLNPSNLVASKPRALRRIIRPPARFKNSSRMALRTKPPVLCARCKTLCEDKDSDGGDLSKTKSKSTLKNGKNKRKGIKEETAAVAEVEVPRIETENIENVDGQDYSYESVGSMDFIENYWRRPFAKDVVKNDAASCSYSVPRELSVKSEGNHALPRLVPIPIPPVNFESSSEYPTNENRGLYSTPVRGRRKKMPRRNFRSEVVNCQGSGLSENGTALPAGPEGVLPTLTRFTEIKDQRIPNELLADYELNHMYLQNSLPKRRTIISRNDSRKRSSTVPVRFRDESYLTRKNVFDFKRHRDDEADEVDGPAQLDSMNSEDMIQHMYSCNEASLDKDRHYATSFNDLNQGPTSNSLLSPSFPNVGNGELFASGLKNDAAFGSKVPTIKISFGSQKNGIVVISQKDSSSLTEISDAEAKAARRALRKEKKKAKRKLSVDTSIQHELPNPPRLHSIPSTQMEESRDISPCKYDIRISDTIFDEEIPPSPPHEPVFLSRRKKKDKKRKREKNFKQSETNSDTEALEHDNREHLHDWTVSEEISQSCWKDEKVVPVSIDSQQLDIKNESEVDSALELTENIVNPVNDGTSETSGTGRQRDSHHRLFISLKRTESSDPNSYISCANPLSGVEFSDVIVVDETTRSSSVHSHSENDSRDFPANLSSPELADSLEVYTDDGGTTYHKGDLVWGKLHGYPWWPGKILDITGGTPEVKAKVSWFHTTTRSFIDFSMIVPFESQFNLKFQKNRKGASYKKAVQAALVQLQQLNPEDFTCND